MHKNIKLTFSFSDLSPQAVDPEFTPTSIRPTSHSVLNNIDSASQITKTIKYFNFLPGGKDIVIVERSGMRFIVRPQPNLNYNGLCVRIEYHIANGVFNGLDRFFSAVAESCNVHVQHLKDAYKLYISNTRTKNGIRLLMEYLVPYKQAVSSSCFYDKNLDVIISNLDIETTPDHPSLTLVAGNIIDLTSMPDTPGIMHTVSFIDNEGIYSSKYICEHGEVTTLEPTTNVALSSGIYTTKFTKSLLGLIQKHSCNVYTVELALEQGIIFNSFEEAVGSNDPEAIKLRNIQEMHEQRLRHNEELKEADIALKLREQKAADAERLHKLKLTEELRLHDLKLTEEKRIISDESYMQRLKLAEDLRVHDARLAEEARLHKLKLIDDKRMLDDKIYAQELKLAEEKRLHAQQIANETNTHDLRLAEEKRNQELKLAEEKRAHEFRQAEERRKTENISSGVSYKKQVFDFCISVVKAIPDVIKILSVAAICMFGLFAKKKAEPAA